MIIGLVTANSTDLEFTSYYKMFYASSNPAVAYHLTFNTYIQAF